MKKVLTENHLWETLRFTIALIMLWAFFDKVFGLGFATPMAKSWLDGVSPTTGFLAFAPVGPLATLFKSLANNLIVDILFMGGLLGVGLSLLLGIGVKLACWVGAIMMFLIYLSLFPPANNPLLDEHLIYVLVFIGLAIRSQACFSLNKWWANTELVRRWSWLR
jgi:thiosulfate dehydrogenase [quinone] large subunit